MATNEECLNHGLHALSRFFVGDGTVGEALERIAFLANDAVAESGMVGLTLIVEGCPRTAVFTDEAALEIDSVQYETGAGPCLDAFRHLTAQRLESTENDTCWPAFSEAAASRGVSSVLSLPLVVNGEGLGALNFYSPKTDAFADSEPLAAAFAAQAAIVIANVRAYWDARSLGEHLDAAMRSRAAIEQAKGIIMASGETADQAFQVLVRASQRENRKLRDVARNLVDEAERRARPSD